MTGPKSLCMGEAQVYREDVVESLLHPSLVGVVSKVGGDSECSSDSSDSENEDEDENENIVAGKARVWWINSDESTENITDLQVLDRGFLHGDIVALASDPLGQIGTVVDINIFVDLEYPNGEVQKNVDSKTLRRIRKFMIGDYVIHGNWLGRVDDVMDNVTVRFDDGSKCKLMRPDPGHLVPVTVSTFESSADCPYYPGLRVRAASSLFKGAKWLRGNWKPSRMEGVVTDVEADTVMVSWITAGNVWDSTSADVPPERQPTRGLIPMVHFSHVGWQLGDRALPPRKDDMNESTITVAETVSDTDAESEVASAVANSAVSEQSLMKLPGGDAGETSNETSSIPKRRPRRCAIKRDKRKSKRKDGPVEFSVPIVHTRTSVDVVWQDGTRGRDIVACNLVPIHHLGDHDFWPEQYVIDRGSDGEGDDIGPRRVGIVKRVDSKQRTASVRWFKRVTSPEDAREFESEEVVSVYELVEHPDYNYCLGDVVIRLPANTDASTKSNAGSELGDDRMVGLTQLIDGTGIYLAVESSKEKPPTDENEICSSKKDRFQQGGVKSRGETSIKANDLFWVGAITGLEDGEIQVEWANGVVSKVGPQAIFVVSHEDDESSTQSSNGDGDEDLDDAASWETVDSNGLNELEKIEDMAGNEEDQEVLDASIESKQEDSSEDIDDQKDDQAANRWGTPLGALGFISRFAAGLLRFKNPVGGVSEENHNAEDMADQESMDAVQNEIDQADKNNASSNEVRYLPDNEADNYTNSVEGTRTSGSSPYDGQICMEVLENFKHFDLVKDPADHHFAREKSQITNQRKWMKKVQQEWLILEKNLPDTIYVRVYEDRMDLLRAVIVGAAGTPYHDGLFFFDFYMPSEYPIVPPVAHYHSGGLRLNPNLYEDGKVCLSLLNTWTGKGLEVWNAEASSILQILVSIQGLVLNSKPYFNEAGYDRQVGTAEGEKNSVGYNENSFLLSCKSMLYLLRRPPKHFEAFVHKHFQCRAANILSACNMYLAGRPVGFANETDCHISELPFEKSSSAGFRIMLAKILPKLAASFAEIGANCSELLQHNGPKESVA